MIAPAIPTVDPIKIVFALSEKEDLAAAVTPRWETLFGSSTTQTKYLPCNSWTAR
jgi:hypothetical protein